MTTDEELSSIDIPELERRYKELQAQFKRYTAP